MQLLGDAAVYSATDLNNFLECRRLTELEDLVARKLLQPPAADDERNRLVRRKGDEHERAYLCALEASGIPVTSIGRRGRGADAYRAAEAETLAAMRDGAPVIYQATFFDGTFLGHADFLRRVETPSALGAWSYEVLDTKLALDAKPYFLVQLCNYSEHLERLQGRAPRQGFIVFGNRDERGYLMHDYAAYYRHLKDAFLTFVSARERRETPDEYPHRRSHCAYCDWNDACVSQRRRDDHLSLVAWMRRDQIAKFEALGITSVERLARATEDERPAGMSPETFAKLRRQAALQVRGRSEGLQYELLRHDAGTGFGIMPPPDEGDVFFDMEGDPLYEPGRSLEYLFGVWAPNDAPEYWAFWALDRVEEKRAFEAFVDYVTERRERYPRMHVYHYANYEKAALRRLAQQHATREDSVDDLLRAEVFVDLYAVARQAVAISEDSYSIKRFEKFYGLERSTETKRGDDSIVMFEHWLETGDRAILDDIERYNADDCRSTYLLRDWLLERRAEAREAHGADYPLREPKAIRELGTEEPPPPPQVDHALLDALLSYHRREEKPAWWAFFDRCDNADDLLEFDREAVGGLQLANDIAARPVGRSRIYTYVLPPQRYKLSAGDKVCDPATHRPNPVGTIVAIDDDRGVLELKSTMPLERAAQLRALIPGGPVQTKAQRDALYRIAESFAAGTLDRDHRAVADMLLARAPHTSGRDAGAPIQPATVDARSVSTVAGFLDESYLFIQGPPGSGKTTIAASVIADLLQRGARVGVTSTGHKAVHNLLHKLEETMASRGASFRGLYKHSDDRPHSVYESRLADPCISSTPQGGAFSSLDFDLAAGTSWLFTRPDLVGAFDYLFIDEAGQVSLADALAVSLSARNVILLGDPAQLAQVSQGTHPAGAGRSVLQHLLGDEATIPPQLGIFLDRSHRMAPPICEFVSDLMYDGRLHATSKAANHRIDSAVFSGAGLRFAPIAHDGNASESRQEAEYIVERIARMLPGTVTDDDGVPRAFRESDFIVVTPYNAQRRLIERLLRERGLAIAVGTVDKFQGQEAAVVFYSMATSSGDDVPRDLDFLFERNRLNVAVSRARALAVLVCNPRLLDVSCNSPEQMAMLNVLCAYVERSGAQEHLAAAAGGLGSA